MKKEKKNKKKVIIIVMVLIIIVIAACVCVMAAEGKFSKKDKKGATPTDATVADAVTEDTMTEDVTTEKITTEDAGTEEKTSTEAVMETVASEVTTESTKPQTTEKPKTTESTNSQTTEKPKTTESAKPQTTEKPKTTEGTKPQTTQAPATTQAQTTECQHNWVAQTTVVHHDAEYEEEQIPIKETHWFCNTCGKDLTISGETQLQHAEASGTYMFNAGTEENPDWWEFYNCGGTHSGPAIVGYETKKYKVKDAWDETVTTGYKCNKCGAVK